MLEWNFDPEIFVWNLNLFGETFRLAPRYYSFTFIFGFMFAFYYTKKIFLKIGRTEEQTSSLLFHVVLGTLLGARLGHCLFYDPMYYLTHPHKILATWEGGLASHGGYIGVLISVWLSARKNPGLTWMWLMDTVCPTALLTGSFIRIGNFLNSEIIGRPTDAAWAVIFKRIDDIPRHPTQLYESIGYFTVAMILFYCYKRYKSPREDHEARWPDGRILGITFVLAWPWRIFIEFFKENQEAFEDGMLLNMGQLLSIPFILIGLYLISGKAHQVAALNFLTKPYPDKKSDTPKAKAETNLPTTKKMTQKDKKRKRKK